MNKKTEIPHENHGHFEKRKRRHDDPGHGDVSGIADGYQYSNEYAYQSCFYNAEGAVMQAVDLMDTEINPKDELPEWMGEDASEINNDTVFTYWEDEAGTGAVDPKSSEVDAAGTELMAVHLGVLPGNSLAMSKPTKHSFSIYSRCEKDGMVILTVGYNNAYK
jgi:hypothetical protein